MGTESHELPADGATKGPRASDGACEMCSAGGGAYKNVFGAGSGASGEGLDGNTKGGD